MQTRGNSELAVRFILTCQEMQSINLNCFSTSSSRAQGNLADTGERADMNEQALAKYKAKTRSGSVAL